MYQYLDFICTSASMPSAQQIGIQFATAAHIFRIEKSPKYEHAYKDLKGLWFLYSINPRTNKVHFMSAKNTVISSVPISWAKRFLPENTRAIYYDDFIRDNHESPMFDGFLCDLSPEVIRQDTRMQ